jgi:hypothetical protein
VTLFSDGYFPSDERVAADSQMYAFTYDPNTKEPDHILSAHVAL